MIEQPTETETPAAHPDAWAGTSPHPVRRFMARQFDNAVLGTILWVAVGTLAWFISPAAGEALVGFTSSLFGRVASSAITLLVMLPVHALMIGLTGSSPGKWLCGIRVRRPDGGVIGLVVALRRKFGVWSIGQGAGLPLISLIAMGNAYSVVNDSGVADWDSEDYSVVAGRSLAGVGMLGMVLASAAVVAAILWGLAERFANAFH